jgi:rhodanese-related sulfurtransferase
MRPGACTPDRRAVIYARAVSEDSSEYELPPERVAEMVQAGEAELIDVRQEFEWEMSRIPAASHVPLDQLPARVAELDDDRTIVFQCRTGARSGMAAQAFRASGREAFNLAGGIEAWSESGLEIEPPNAPIALPRPDNS